LGWRPESLSRAFHALAGEGSIALKKSDLIELRDIYALGAVAGDEYVANDPTMEQLSETLKKRDD
jgi:CRP/FNR family transcriptional regulator